jgi:hypothetical protein
MDTKLDLNEYLRGVEHAPGSLDNVLRGAVALDVFLLHLIPPDIRAAELVQALHNIKLPGDGDRTYDLLPLLTPRRWDRYSRDAVIGHFHSITDRSEVLAWVEDKLRRDYRNRLFNHGVETIPADELTMYFVLLGLPLNDEGNASAFGELFGDRVRYRPTDDKWYLWSEHYWRRAPGADVDRLMTRVLHARLEAALMLKKMEDDEEEDEGEDDE